MLTEDTRSRLLANKLIGICRSLGVEGAEAAAGIVGGATAIDPSGRGWVLVQDEAARGLGAALAWGERRSGGVVTCVVDVDREGRPQSEAGAALTRRLAGLAPGADGRVGVVVVDGATVGIVPAAPVEAHGPFSLDPIFEPLLPAAAAAGVEIEVHADGTASLEVLGLEVGRFARSDDGSPLLRVGAGRHDRDTFDELFDGAPTALALASAAAMVRTLRHSDAGTGPGNLLQRARWMRSVALSEGRSLVAIPEATPAEDLRTLRCAAAIAEDGTLVAFSAGIDLDLVPTIADAWLRCDAAGRTPHRVEVHVPTGDDMAITTDLLRHLLVPAHLSAVTPPWDG